jgi:hypothetical protein
MFKGQFLRRGFDIFFAWASTSNLLFSHRHKNSFKYCPLLSYNTLWAVGKIKEYLRYILTVQHTKRGEKLPNGSKIHQIIVKCTTYIDGHKKYKNFPFHGPPKYTKIGKPSGKPADDGDSSFLGYWLLFFQTFNFIPELQVIYDEAAKNQVIML